jgi:REP element-mobilizing transposase RayT
MVSSPRPALLNSAMSIRMLLMDRISKSKRNHESSKTALLTRIRLAYHSSLPQEGIPAQIRKGPSKMAPVVIPGKNRYDLSILNYMATSHNHIHLLMFDRGQREVIPRFLQLVAGRTGQQYNQRKKRKGAFWEDRYHATAVETNEHLIQCLVYMDLNMVRAGVVSHPSEWNESGFKEIRGPRQRYSLIDHRYHLPQEWSC